MKTETKFRLIAAGIVVGVTVWSTYTSNKIERTIAEGQKKMREQKFEIIIPLPPEF